jgi:hypothetical protein
MSYPPEPKPAPYAMPPAGQPHYGVSYQDPQQVAARQFKEDSDHLQILSILYYVMAGFAALGGCVPFVYFGIGAILIGGAAAAEGEPEGRAGLAMFGGVIIVFATVIAVLIWGHAICLFLTGKYLSQSRHHLFCFLNACLLCLNAPFGTALGIFTIIVLSRQSVKQRFEAVKQGYFLPQYR